jgi:hypothetical protein
VMDVAEDAIVKGGMRGCRDPDGNGDSVIRYLYIFFFSCAGCRLPFVASGSFT